MKARKLILLVSALAAAVAVAGVSYASIPGANGMISACKDAKGTLKVIDAEAGQTCPGNQQLLGWNHQGPAGAPGPPGTSGFERVDSTSTQPLDATTKAAWAYCPAGKIAVGGGSATHQVSDGEPIALAHGVAIVASAPIQGGVGWYSWARVVAPSLADVEWQLEVSALCMAAA